MSCNGDAYAAMAVMNLRSTRLGLKAYPASWAEGRYVPLLGQKRCAGL